MFILSYTNTFEKDLKRIKKRSTKDLELIYDFLNEELSQKQALSLAKKYRAHKLSGNYANHWECHIKSDLLIIWFEVLEEGKIRLIRVGTHADLF